MKAALEAGQFEESVKNFTDSELKLKTDEFKNAINAGTSPGQLLPEVFAVVRETAKRKLDMRHFDVQLIGGKVLYDGKIAEMATGEGKTLVATLASYMVYLTGKKVHVITVNDYLAKRDAEWMRPVYEALGLTVGAIQADMDPGGPERKAQYNCDITYGTNNEFGFDYLRDNMKTSVEAMAQSPLEYAIIDEVDSILIDEARTPLIISGPAFDDTSRYKKADAVCRQLMEKQRPYENTQKQIDTAQLTIANAKGELAEAKKQKDAHRADRAQKVIDLNEKLLAEAQLKLEYLTQLYEIEFDRKAVHLTHDGIGTAQELAGLGSFFTGSNIEWPHLLEQALRAHIVFEKEIDYVVMEGKIIIVDTFTGRLMHGRQWSDGLHQAVEAKEGVQVKEETQTLATITLQNFFKLYEKISGMTGTALTEAEEFMSIYKLDVVTIPTNKPCIRDDRHDLIYKTMKEKFNAIVDDIHEVSSKGCPILVGTVSIEKSEAISNVLTKKFGIEHEVLNAKQHQREALIVEKAGYQYKARDGKMHGNVTIATNMAGRGTDIKLAPGVPGIGGLHIVGTERHESRRIDNQLRGRAGRQGDKGSSQFFLSFEDDLIKIFSPEWMVKALSWIGWEEGQPVYHPKISKGIEKAQKKVEERNYEQRKSLLEYDEVMDYQRKIFYSRRKSILKGIDLKETITGMIDSVIPKTCPKVINEKHPYNCISEWAFTNFNIDLRPEAIAHTKPEEIEELIKKTAAEKVANSISISLGEYLEDFEDKNTWDIPGLCKWAMSSFSVNLSQSKIKDLTAEELEEMLIEASAKQVDKKDCSQIAGFLREDFNTETITNWANAKFDLKINTADFNSLNAEQANEFLLEKLEQKYRQREIEYPVEFACNLIFGPEGPNVYGFEALAKWANKKYDTDLKADQLQNTQPAEIKKQLLRLSTEHNNGKLRSTIDKKVSLLTTQQLVEWANQRFDADLDEELLADSEDKSNIVTRAAQDFMRKELADLEKYVLLQVYDASWKDHLYAMDHLKESIFLRAFAEKDPKVEYKQEGYRMFNEMLDTIDDRVSDIIFKIHIAPGSAARNVWNVSKTQHDQVSQFAATERQRAAATAPQGERVIKQIKLDQPKVGRNDLCPCGSGKKYKKCCGINA